MTTFAAVAALVSAWRTINDPALAVLTWPRYPRRELRPVSNADGSVTLTISKFGYGYKRRGPKPREPPVADLARICALFNIALNPGCHVRDIQDRGKTVNIVLEEFL